MRTKASIKSHSIHQMLIPFPIAFLVGSVVSDTWGLIKNNTDFYYMGEYLVIAGIITGLAAAVPGFIDYIFSVPPKSSGKTRATKHMIVNVTAIIIFFISIMLRDEFSNSPEGIPIILQYAGVVLLAAGGWMGGTMVNRNFFGPEHRYANATKWTEKSFNYSGEPVKIVSKDELKVDQMKLVKINGERIVVARTEEGYRAFHDRCTHSGASLADGILICSTVQCIWHGSQFNVNTGNLKAGPAEKPIKTYPLEEKNDGYYLSLP